MGSDGVTRDYTSGAILAVCCVYASRLFRVARDLPTRVEARRFAVFGERITLPARRKVAIALRCWAGARLGRTTA